MKSTSADVIGEPSLQTHARLQLDRVGLGVRARRDRLGEPHLRATRLVEGRQEVPLQLHDERVAAGAALAPRIERREALVQVSGERATGRSGAAGRGAARRRRGRCRAARVPRSALQSGRPWGLRSVQRSERPSVPRSEPPLARPTLGVPTRAAEWPPAWNRPRRSPPPWRRPQEGTYGVVSLILLLLTPDMLVQPRQMPNSRVAIHPLGWSPPNPRAGPYAIGLPLSRWYLHAYRQKTPRFQLAFTTPQERHAGMSDSAAPARGAGTCARSSSRATESSGR